MSVNGYGHRQRMAEVSDPSTWERFQQIDANANGVIELREALRYFASEPSKHQFDRNAFLQMDKNGNGVIEPSEFDVDLA